MRYAPAPRLQVDELVSVASARRRSARYGRTGPAADRGEGVPSASSRAHRRAGRRVPRRALMRRERRIVATAAVPPGLEHGLGRCEWPVKTIYYIHARLGKPALRSCWRFCFGDDRQRALGLAADLLAPASGSRRRPRRPPAREGDERSSRRRIRLVMAANSAHWRRWSVVHGVDSRDRGGLGARRQKNVRIVALWQARFEARSARQNSRACF